jgi:hypothetical protein
MKNVWTFASLHLILNVMKRIRKQGNHWGTWNCFHRKILVWFGLLCLWELTSLLRVGHPLCQEDGSVICSAIIHWLESHRTHNHILLSHLRLLQPGGPGPRIYISQEQGGPVIPSSIGLVSFSSPLMARRTMAEVFKPAWIYWWIIWNGFTMKTVPLQNKVMVV